MYKILYLLYLCRGQIKVSTLFLFIYLFLYFKVSKISSSTVFIYSTNRLAKQTVKLTTFYHCTFIIRLFTLDFKKIYMKMLLPCL